jgi:DNA polymerase type B, organellar and viral
MHRVEHTPDGNPCSKCGLAAVYHRVRATADFGRSPARLAKVEPTYIGIDGEGQGRKDHRYIFLAASNEDGTKRWSIDGLPDHGVEGHKRLALSTEDALDFILSIPQTRGTKIFAYAFGYDLTKILTDVDNKNLYKLFRPELRKRPLHDARKGLIPVYWRNFKINLQASKFTVKRGKRKAVIWDIFKFFQGRFVAAIQDWKVGDETLWNRMQRMKEQRGEFDKLDWAAVQEYCFEECACMAGLARKLTEAHEKAGLKLKNYYGAGSSAEAMLTVMGIKQKLREPPDEIRPIAQKAFFGGRFENSILGTISGTVYGYDISSAYPYELCFLPCLEHGTWEYTEKRQDLDGPDVKQALVHYRLSKIDNRIGKTKSWGPFPFREKEGTICFPYTSGGGWIYRDEFLVGEKLFDNVIFREAWVYKTGCECQPFKKIPEYYAERVRIGKEGPGIVIKLGCNSCYGKLAQSVGAAKFQSWLWAGMITSGTRAKLLELVGLVKDRSSILMMATDGIVSRERIVTPVPKDTGTFEVKKGGVPIPLGGWEEKISDKGMFFARPGIYFPLHPTAKEASSVRGRGVGRKAILENWEGIVRAGTEFLQTEDSTKTVTIAEVSRFCGVKSSLSISTKNGITIYSRASGTGKAPAYGQWITRPVELSFNPLPKRAGLGREVEGHVARQLLVRRVSLRLESAIYDKALDKETSDIKSAEAEVMEQPDADLFEVS